MKTCIIVRIPPAKEQEKAGCMINVFSAVLKKIVPAANPSFDSLYDRVSEWHVEIDTGTGEPLREVGFSADGTILAIGPWQDNYGFIVDSNATFNPDEHERICNQQFECEWSTFTSRQHYE